MIIVIREWIFFGAFSIGISRRSLAALLVFFWTIELQFLLQIIANRIVLILPGGRGRHIKLLTFGAVFLINISVYVVWLPARLQLSHKSVKPPVYVLFEALQTTKMCQIGRWMHFNEVYDRIEKTLYLLVDSMLNGYFIFMVRKHLVTYGLRKYNRLWKFNLRMIAISLSMDVSHPRTHSAGFTS